MRTAPLGVRERFAVDDPGPALAKLVAAGGVLVELVEPAGDLHH